MPSPIHINTPISAPFDAEYARRGFSSFHIRYKISPITGNKAPTTTIPLDSASKELLFCALLLQVLFPCIGVLFLHESKRLAPQFSQNFAPSDTCFPQFLQYIFLLLFLFSNILKSHKLF